MAEHAFHVEHRTEESRYVLLDAGAEIGEESYRDVPAETSGSGAVERIFFHTRVDERYGGRGLASVLVRAAVEDAIAAGLRIVPVCPYVAAWLPKHPEFAGHVVEPTPAHVRAVRAR